jgi:hypothetical protein
MPLLIQTLRNGTREVARAAALVLFCVLPLAGCGSENDAGGRSSEVSVKGPELASIDVKGFQIAVSREGQLGFWVRAEGGRLPADNSRASLFDVSIVEYKNDVEHGSLQADEGTYFLKDVEEDNIKKNNAFLWGNVLLQQSDGLKLSTTEAMYEGGKGKLSSEKHTEIEKPVASEGSELTVLAAGESFEMTRGEAETLIRLRGRGDTKAAFEFKTRKPESASGAEEEGT